MNNKVSIPKGAWVMVADYGKALLLKNNGTPTAPVFEVMQAFEAPENPPARDQGTDRPGRTYFGSHRSAVDQTDWHAVAGKRFLEEALEAVEKAYGDEEFQSLVLVAPPRALADLRSNIPDSVREVVVGELDKDLTGMPVAEIARHLAS